MGKVKKIKLFSILLTVVLFVNVIACSSFESEAASTRSILNKACKHMAKYSSVFYKYNQTYELDDQKYSFPGTSISDNSISYSIDAQEEQWHIKSRLYAKFGYSSSWTITKTDHDNSRPSKYYGKKLFQYVVKNLKSPKITKNTKTAYVIVGNTNISDFYKIEIKINKKDNSVAGITFYYNDFDTQNSYGETKTVKNQKWAISNMCYGHTKLKAPKF